VSLQKISEFNGEEMSLNLEDVEDKLVAEMPASPDALVPKRGSSSPFRASAGEQMDYQALRKTSISDEPDRAENSSQMASPTISRRPTSHSRASSRSLSKGQLTGGRLPRWIRKPLHAWFKRLGMVLSPEWRRTTILVWVVWWAMSLGKFLGKFHFLFVLMGYSFHHVQRLSSKAVRREDTICQ
jgi:hypothetical protein